MSTPQEILDALTSYYVSIGALEREKGHHSAIVVNIDIKIKELREKTAAIEKGLIKPPEVKDVSTKTV